MFHALRGIVSLWCLLCAAPIAGAAEPDRPEEDTIAVIIQGRRFIPDHAILQQGRKTRLMVRNHDSELHTFAPMGSLASERFDVSGNGAPEFWPEGLKRVIIPADGVAEIRFTPTKPGEYRYICDMPGHQMTAALVVE